MVKVDRRISWHYTTTILRLRIGARLTRYRNCKFHNFARSISRHADGISRYSVPPSAGGPLLPLGSRILASQMQSAAFCSEKVPENIGSLWHLLTSTPHSILRRGSYLHSTSLVRFVVQSDVFVCRKDVCRRPAKKTYFRIFSWFTDSRVNGTVDRFVAVNFRSDSCSIVLGRCWFGGRKGPALPYQSKNRSRAPGHWRI